MDIDTELYFKNVNYENCDNHILKVVYYDDSKIRNEIKIFNLKYEKSCTKK